MSNPNPKEIFYCNDCKKIFINKRLKQRNNTLVQHYCIIAGKTITRTIDKIYPNICTQNHDGPCVYSKGIYKDNSNIIDETKLIKNKYDNNYADLLNRQRIWQRLTDTKYWNNNNSKENMLDYGVALFEDKDIHFNFKNKYYKEYRYVKNKRRKHVFRNNCLYLEPKRLTDDIVDVQFRRFMVKEEEKYVKDDEYWKYNFHFGNINGFEILRKFCDMYPSKISWIRHCFGIKNEKDLKCEIHRLIFNLRLDKEFINAKKLRLFDNIILY